MSEDISAVDPATYNKWASRKFWLTVGFDLLMSLLLWFGKIEASLFVTLVLPVTTGYLLVNVYQKTIGTKD